MVELDVGWVHVVDPVFGPSGWGFTVESKFLFLTDSLVRSFAWPLSSTSILLASLYRPRLSQVTYSFLLATCESFPLIHISYLILLVTFRTKILDRSNKNCLRKPPSNRVSRQCHLSQEAGRKFCCQPRFLPGALNSYPLGLSEMRRKEVRR